MPPKTPRPYQQRLINNINETFKNGLRSAILQAKTGSGKTIIAADYAMRTQAKGRRFVALFAFESHLKNFEKELKEYGLLYQKVEAQKTYINSTGIIISMTKTFVNRAKSSKANMFGLVQETDILLPDECHLQHFNDALDLFEEHNPNVYKLGLSATPQRYGKQRQLYINWDRIIPGPTSDDLVAMGSRAVCDYYSVRVEELENLKTTQSGDYRTEDVFNAMDKPRLYSGLVDNWESKAKGLSTLCFCVNILQAIRACEEFKNRGYAAKFVSSKPPTPKQGKKIDEEFEIIMNKHAKKLDGIARYSGDNDEITQQWRENKFMVLVNVDMYTAGFDRQDLECVVIYRATAVLSLYLQMDGRIRRGTGGVVLDFGDHLKRFKCKPDPEITWSLVHKKGTKSGAVVQNSKICEKCFKTIPDSWAVCEFCGQIDEKRLKQKAKEGKKLTEVELELIDPEKLKHLGIIDNRPPDMKKFIESVAKNVSEKKINVYKGGTEAVYKYGWEGFAYYMEVCKLPATFENTFRSKIYPTKKSK